MGSRECSNPSIRRGGSELSLRICSARRREVDRVFGDVFTPGQRSITAKAVELPVVVAAAGPLRIIALVDAALLILQMTLGRARSTLVGRLLRSPFLKAGEMERDVRALADVRLREEQRDYWDWAELERWAGINGCPLLQVACRDVGTQHRSFPRTAFRANGQNTVIDCCVRSDGPVSVRCRALNNRR